MKRARAVAAFLVLGLAALVPRTVEARPFGGPYFPADTQVPEDDAGWSALARRFPTRIKLARPDAAAGIQAPTATRIEVRSGLEYVRVRRLGNDLAVIEGALESPEMIIDLRYVRSELADALAFGSLLTREDLALQALAAPDAPATAMPSAHKRAAGQTTLVLVNRATAGPLEAVLDALQAAGEVLLVGTQTAGDTGYFVDVQGANGWRVILDDFRRARGPSLLDVGVTPGLFIDVARDAEDRAYLALDAGTPLPDLLDAPVQKPRFDEASLLQQFDQVNSRNGNNGTGTDSPSDRPASREQEASAEGGQDAAFDRTLQRAVSTLIAHEVLGHPVPNAGN